MPGEPGTVKAVVEKTARAMERDLADLSLRIHANPELGHQEHKAVEWCRQTLERLGFELRSFRVSRRRSSPRCGSRGRTTIGFLAEYDALPGVNHGWVTIS